MRKANKSLLIYSLIFILGGGGLTQSAFGANVPTVSLEPINSLNQKQKECVDEPWLTGEATEPQPESNGAVGGLHLSAAQIRQVEEFYSNEDFATGLTDEIRAYFSFVDSDITPEGLKKVFPGYCHQVIKQVSDTVQSMVTPRLLEGPKDIRAACPQWESLSDGDRRDFYVALVTAMALAESTCNNGARARGVNSTAYGYWQLTSAKSPGAGAKETMRRIDSQVAQSGLLFWGNSLRNYWAVLNPNIHAHKVKKFLKKIPACVGRAATAAAKQGGK